MSTKLISKIKDRSDVLARYALIATVGSLVIVYYQQEPSPADFIMAITLALGGGSYILRSKLKPFSWIDLPLALYLVYVAVQAAVQLDTLDLRFALITLYLGSTCFVLKYLVVKFGQKGLRWLWIGYVVGAVITALLMCWQLINVYSLGGNWDLLYFGRPNGWFKDANVAGPFLIPAVLYSLYNFISNKRLLYLGMFYLLSVGLFMSFSRGAYLGYVCSVALLCALMYWSNWRVNRVKLWSTAKLIAISLVGIIYIWGALNIYQPFFNLTVDRFGTLIKEYDTQGRAVSWEAGLKNAGKSPFGAGSGNYEKTSLQYQWSMSSLYGNPRKAKESTPSAQNRQGFNEVSGEEITTDEGEEIIVTPSAHNTYIRVLLENGLIGLSLLVLAWGWLAVAGAKVVWRINELPEWLKIYVLISFISFLAFLPMGTFIDTLHWRFLWVMAGILGGVIFIAGRYLIEEKSGGQ